ncbi:MAG: efflux RND transporter periplasmic adaptor subunit [bacterium]
MKKLFGLFVLLFSLFFTGCKNEKKDISQTDKEIIPVKVTSLIKEDVQRTIITSGQFTTDDETYLSFKTGGVINKIYVKEGDAIKKGQLLATLNLGEIDAMVQQAKIGYEKALRDYNRVNNLYKDSVTTLEQLQNAKSGLDISTKQLNIAEFNKDYSEIRALENGYVLKKFANEGQMIGSGMPVIQTNGANNNNWLLKVTVSDIEWAVIKLHDRAEVKLDAYPDQMLTAYVLRKSEGIDPYTGTFSVDLKLESNFLPKIASGLFGKANIIPSKILSSWLIPYEALLDGDGNTGYLFITNDNTTVKKVKVTIAEINKNNVLISAGLEKAKFLIVSGSAYLNDNSKIKIVK